MKSRRFAAVLSLSVVLAMASLPAQADWQEPEPGPITGGSLGTSELLLEAAAAGLEAATVAL